MSPHPSHLLVIGCVHCSRRIVVAQTGRWVHIRDGAQHCYSSRGDKLEAEPGVDSLARLRAALDAVTSATADRQHEHDDSSRH